MILSEKSLRPWALPEGSKCCVCGAENDSRFYYDPPARKFYCSSHTLLEDLDPLNKRNASMLFGCPVSRLTVFPELENIRDLLVPITAPKRGEPNFYCRSDMFPNLRVMPTPALTAWVYNNMLYPRLTPDKYFFDLHIREYGGVDLAWLSLRYQEILGTRYLAVVTRANVEKIFGAVK